MILGIQAQYFWYLLALTGVAGGLVIVVAIWYRSVAADADLGARWVANCGSREKAGALLASYERKLDAKLKSGLTRLETQEIARADTLGEQMIRDALTNPPRAMLSEAGPCCAKGGRFPEDTQ